MNLDRGFSRCQALIAGCSGANDKAVVPAHASLAKLACAVTGANAPTTSSSCFFLKRQLFGCTYCGSRVLLLLEAKLSFREGAAATAEVEATGGSGYVTVLIGAGGPKKHS